MRIIGMVLILTMLVSGCATTRGYHAKGNGNTTRLTIIYQRYHFAVRQEGGWALVKFRINIPIHAENREFQFKIADHPVQTFHLEDTTQEHWTLYRYVGLGVHKVHVELWHEDGRAFDWDGLVWVR